MLGVAQQHFGEWIWRLSHEGGAGFLLRILWHSPSGNHSQNNSAQIWLHIRYECRKEKHNPSIFLATYHKNLVIWKKKNLQNLVNLGFFFMKNPLNRSKWYFSGKSLAKNCQ
jgi:hypothetical protein